MTTQAINGGADTEVLEALDFKPRRVRGLRLPVLPSGTLLAQLAGGAAVLWGTYMTWGLGRTLIVGGIAAVVLGALKEAGKI
jgi:hypothetical protein